MTPEQAVSLLLQESEWAEKTGLGNQNSPYIFNRYRAISIALASLLERVEKLEGTLDKGRDALV